MSSDNGAGDIEQRVAALEHIVAQMVEDISYCEFIIDQLFRRMRCIREKFFDEGVIPDIDQPVH